MSPRNSFAEARRTRERILERSVALASVEGLEGLTLGRLATDLHMSKAGVLGHFGSKEALQLATLEQGYAIFSRIALEPAARVSPGLARLRVLFDGWINYLTRERESFPGGCLFTTAAIEFDARGGPVRDAVAALFAGWREDLVGQVRYAVEAGELSADTDADQVAFELLSLFTSLNMSIQLFADPTAVARTRRAVDRLLGTTPPA